jgi:septal ring factor EnvC (AmiA/AmiB activator)
MLKRTLNPRPHRRGKCLANACGVLLLAAGSAAPADPIADEAVEAKRADLREVERELETLEQDLLARHSSRAVLIDELERFERDIAQLARSGHQLDAMIQQQLQALEALQRGLAAKRGELARERRSIAALMRSAHALGSNEHIRMLLDQEDGSRLGRMMSYYGYLNRYRLQRLRDYAEQARGLEALRREAADETERLARLAARQERTKTRLGEAQARRAELLADLERTIATREERFAALRDDAEGLRALVEQLERQAAILPEADVAQEPIDALRGRLAWPLAGGELVERFGGPKGDSGQRWDGVLIAAPAGAEVRAVHHGRVAYADWLRGFGLLIIIEHDNGYMSLYGRNQTLLKESGEWVAGGETIALSGSSGGQRGPALYFAIRHHGRPVDPERWCRSQSALGQTELKRRTGYPVGERHAISRIKQREAAPLSDPRRVIAKPQSESSPL